MCNQIKIKFNSNFIDKGKEVVSSITSRVFKVAQSVIESIKYAYHYTTMTLRSAVVKIAARNHYLKIVKTVLGWGPISQKVREAGLIEASKNNYLAMAQSFLAGGSHISEEA